MTKPLSGRNFLIVDDSTDNQTLFSRFLKLAGGNVTLACDGRAGLDAFFDCRRAGQTYDAVIMDIRMPVMGLRSFPSFTRGRLQRADYRAHSACGTGRRGKMSRIRMFAFSDETDRSRPVQRNGFPSR